MKLILKRIDELNLEEFDLNKLSEYQKRKVNNVGSLASYYILDKYFNITSEDIKYENGKPLIDNGYISISHKNNYVVVVYSDYKIGVDIEEIKEYRKSLVNDIFTSEEQEYLKNNINGFHKIYTVKECIIKINNWNLRDISTFSVVNNNSIQYEGFNIQYKYFDNYIMTIVEEV